MSGLRSENDCFLIIQENVRTVSYLHVAVKRALQKTAVNREYLCDTSLCILLLNLELTILKNSQNN